MISKNESKADLLVRPIPDPTELTTDQLRREIGSLRELLETRIAGGEERDAVLRKQVEQRQQDIDAAIKHIAELMASNLESLALVTDEKFARIETQFNERDTRTDQRAGDTKLAVDAAFAAAKEATAKIEAGFTKQIDSMAGTVDTKTQNLDGRLADLKDRLTALENRLAGVSKGGSDLWGFAVGAVGMILAAVSIVALIVKWVAH